jgi:hypothetical protein
MTKRNWILAPDRHEPDQWRVEGIDTTEGDCSVAIFCGTDAERNAREYFEMKSAQEIKTGVLA